ncbi:MAG TPA: ATP-binding protein [Trueperaceae bacterium]
MNEASLEARTLERAEQELAEVRRELELRTQQLESLARELETFSYSVSHDLRAPLRAVDGFSQALLEDYGGKLDETAQRYVARIRGGAQRMGELIDALLSLSRLSRSEVNFGPVNLSRLAEDIAGRLAAETPERHVEVVIEPDLWAHGDERLLRLALEQLIENAWKFTAHREQARIALRAETEGERAVYVVEDNGAGFDMRYADKLFGIFQRLHGPDEYPGSGVGLATVQRIVHRHQGHISGTGEVGGGASFRFTLGPDILPEGGTDASAS